MITKGGLETVTQHLAMEYARDGIRVNAVAPGAVYTPLHRGTPKEVMEGLSPMGRPSTVKDITDAVLYLTDAATVTGHILYLTACRRLPAAEHLRPDRPCQRDTLTATI
jgi:NAD(P)-dependent dehydrogenase (short-subunit alcohol dehydrogenase family)